MQPSPEQVLLAALEAPWAPQAARDAWLATARPEQLTPPGDWLTWLINAGRGWGKTRTGAQDAAWYGQINPGSRIAVVAPTYSDGRDTCIEGESGLLSVIPAALVDAWNRSLGELILTNGTRYKLFSSEEPERLRGPQHHRAWADELGAWRRPSETWDQLMFGLRLCQSPRVVVTTTPKPTKLIKALMAAPTTIITRGSTFENAANLAASALETFRDRYEGTRLGRQELYAELLDDTPGALWTREMIEAARCDGAPAMQRIVIGVDPSGSNGETGDSQGIVVAGLGVDGRGYVIQDATMRGSPEQWGSRVAALYDVHQADRVVAERNYGGAMVEAVLRAAAPHLPVTLVTASRGKHVRAEPIAALYEQRRISHLDNFPELEDQMAAMASGGFSGPGSPDALDAMVWALTELMVDLPVNGAAYLEMARIGLGRLPGPSDQRKIEYQPGSVEWAAEQATKAAASAA